MGKEMIKRKNASELVLTVMIWAMVGLLGTRLYLEIMGYPQIGKGDWHVAHALIGGLVMTAGMMIDLVFYGTRTKKIAAGVFGLGMGWFIDEVGKYLSRDNNYFFQPAIVVIYAFFVILFLIYKYLEKRETRDGVSENKEMGISWEAKWWRQVRKITYHKIFRRKIVINILFLIAVGYVVAGAGDAVFLWGTFRNDRDISMFTFKSITDLIIAVVFGIGIYMVSRKKRRRGINFFRYGLLVNIFLSSIFNLYFEQFSAVIGLGFSVAIYYGLDKMRRELIETKH
ncbi:MAG: hypothetical protein WC841_05445 [Candidatus Shapirobacteria bacterium]